MPSTSPDWSAMMRLLSSGMYRILSSEALGRPFS
jgi:hypothetical protein